MTAKEREIVHEHTVEEITSHLPQPDEWVLPSIRLTSKHGDAHAFECLLIGHLVLPLLKQQGVHDIDDAAAKGALGRHDIGRKNERHDGKHALLGAMQLYTIYTREGGTLTQSSGRFKNLSAQSFFTMLEYFRDHSEPKIKNPSNGKLFVQMIDRWTMFGRFRDQPKWLSHFNDDVLLTGTPIFDNTPALSIIQIHKFIKLSTTLHLETEKIAHRNNGISHLDAEIKAARKLGMIK